MIDLRVLDEVFSECLISECLMQTSVREYPSEDYPSYHRLLRVAFIQKVPSDFRVLSIFVIREVPNAGFIQRFPRYSREFFPIKAVFKIFRALRDIQIAFIRTNLDAFIKKILQ
ncbi:hypothetical protein PIB30_107181 [Stylosanthes scabra]|uniref:Uncharacterized protein n=1 Tax=Stylosanthes scabra TaxID=79078 RepID=A0ABU6YXW3_9FABA|nr:hypothetical protein [Stylosanthes scabra]